MNSSPTGGTRCRDRSTPSRSVTPRWLSLALVALLASSCARQLPTAAVTTPTHAPLPRTSTATVTRSRKQKWSSRSPRNRPGGDRDQYGATLLEYDAVNMLAVFLPGGTQTAAELVTLMATDARLTTSESNGWIVPARARQKSFAFDDGFGSLANAVEQPAATAIACRPPQR